MAKRIAGITIEIDGNAKPLQKELQSVDKSLRTTQSNLKDVDKLLKLDPGNADLLRQKQKLLNTAIEDTKKKLDTEKEALAQLAAADQTPEVTAQMEALQRQIADDEAKLSSFKGQMKDFGSVAGQQMQAVGDKIKAVGGKIENVGKKLAPVSGAAAAIGGALLKMGYSTVQSADELNTLAKQTGFTVEELQRMQYASDLVDVSVDDITGALRKFKKNIDPSNESLQKLGVSALDANGSLRDSTDVFYDAISALGKIENETERDQMAMALFGKSADELAGIIDDGGAALKAYGDEAESMGLVLSGDTIDSLNETNDTIDKVKANVTATFAEIGSDVATVLGPAIEKVGDFIKQITEKLRSLSPEQTEMILKIVGVVAALAPLLIVVGKIVSLAGTLVSGIGAVVGVLGGPLTIAIAAVIAIGVLLWKNWDKIKEFAIQLKDKVVAAWTAIKDGVTKTTENMKNMISNKLTAIKNAYNNAGGGIKGIVSGMMEAVKQYFTLGFDFINTLTGGKLNAIKEKFSSIFSNIKATVQGAIEHIKNLFNFNWSLPHIKLPHFTVSPAGWKFGDLLKGTIPSLSISWYKRAYDDPVIFTRPTVMATPYGLKGFGDGNGAEIVMGLNKLREMAGPNVVINMSVVTQPGQDNRAIAAYVSKDIMQQVNKVKATWR